MSGKRFSNSSSNSLGTGGNLLLELIKFSNWATLRDRQYPRGSYPSLFLLHWAHTTGTFLVIQLVKRVGLLQGDGL
jgi:hypothetical protein